MKNIKWNINQDTHIFLKQNVIERHSQNGGRVVQVFMCQLHGKCPIYDLDTQNLRSPQLMYECCDIWTNATVYLRRKSTTFTWKIKN